MNQSLEVHCVVAAVLKSSTWIPYPSVLAHGTRFSVRHTSFYQLGPGPDASKQLAARDGYLSAVSQLRSRTSKRLFIYCTEPLFTFTKRKRNASSTGVCWYCLYAKQPISSHLVQPIAWGRSELGLKSKFDVCRTENLVPCAKTEG